MLQVAQLTRKYGDFIAVNDVGFSIGKGEIVGLLGHNGAGKTTIMKILSGYLEANSGRVTINDFDLNTDAKSIQKDLGYLPENLPIYPEMTVADYLDYVADMKGIAEDQKAGEIKRVIHATEIREKLLDPIETLSRGYKQRVGVAQAILGKPKLLILDEPTNGLDPTQTEHMRRLVKEIAKDATVILSTHIMQEVDAICDRVLILSNGHLALDARLEELRKSNRLIVQCSLNEEQVNNLSNELTGIESSTLDSEGKYFLQLDEDVDRSNVSALVAEKVLAQGGKLFQLTLEQRDLESVFREVSRANISATFEKEIENVA